MTKGRERSDDQPQESKGGSEATSSPSGELRGEITEVPEITPERPVEPT
jgi:hypothetical protein